MVIERWMTAADAARVLGVKPATLYSYVSRGVISRETVRIEGGRCQSRFDRAEVIALASARRRSRGAGPLAGIIESDVTQLDSAGGLSVRGVAVSDLVDLGFEKATRVVLQALHAPWPSAVVHCDPRLPALDRIRVALIHASVTDPRRGDLDRAHCQKVGLTAVEAACVAVTGRGVESGSVSERLGAHWGVTASQTVLAIDKTLVALIDHELAASTLAARAAASAHADPWMTLLAGHAALGGIRSGNASIAVVDFLHSWHRNGIPEPVPGFGHFVYEGPDPRAGVILEAARSIDANVVADAEDLCVAVARRHSLYPNVDLGLAALVIAAGLPFDAGSVLYGVSRLAGLGAHAMEEYPHAPRLRPRAVPGLPMP